MKVILTKNVPKIGHKYQVLTVADGYAANFLFPNKLAEQATQSALVRVEKLMAEEKAQKSIREDLLIKNLKQIDGVKIEVTEKANAKGHLFAAVHKEVLIPALKEQTRLDIDAEHIVLDKPLKEVGEHKVTVKVQDKTAVFTVNILAK